MQVAEQGDGCDGSVLGRAVRRSYDTRVPRPGSPRGRAVPAALALGAVALAAALVALLRLTLWSEDVPAPLPVDVDAYFDPAELAGNRRYREGLWAFAIALAPLPAAIAIAVAATGARWRSRLLRIAGGRVWWAGALFGAGLALLTAVVTLPLRAARFAWARAEGPVVQSSAGWSLDVVVATGIQMLVMGALGLVVVVLVFHAGRWWPAGLAALAATLVVAATFAGPLVAELFMRTEPLRDPQLRAQLVDLADRAGVQVDDVRVNDASARTRSPNAFVGGLGSTRRIVLYDTLVEGFPPEQVRLVTAHELAHIERRHIERGPLWAGVLMLPAVLLVTAAVGWRPGFEPPGRDAPGRELAVRRLAIIAAAALTLGVVATPLVNWVSRAYEAEADWIMLQLTDDPDAAIAFRQGRVDRAVAVPDPPRAIQFWFGTHPTSLDRIGLAERARAEPEASP